MEGNEKEGMWILYGSDSTQEFRCSQCRKLIKIPGTLYYSECPYKYCLNCGKRNLNPHEAENDVNGMTEKEKEKERLGEAIDEAIKHTLIDLDGEVLTLGEAIRKYRGGNYLATKWRKCSEKQPETPRNALICRLGYVEFGFWDGKDWCMVQESELIPMQIQPTHWMNLPLPPAPDGGIENGT